METPCGEQHNSETQEERSISKSLSHVCHVCGRRFARREHLLRHERIHTCERPFLCPHCFHRFSRLDARFRHVNNFCSKRVLSTSTKNGGVRRCRSRAACDSCYERKQKCNGTNPCDPCRKRESECTFARNRNMKISPAPNHGTSPNLDPAAALLMSFFSNQDYTAESIRTHPASEIVSATTRSESKTPDGSLQGRQVEYPIVEGISAPNTLQPYSIHALNVAGIVNNSDSFPDAGTILGENIVSPIVNERSLGDLGLINHWEGLWDVGTWQGPVQETQSTGNSDTLALSDPLAFLNTSFFNTFPFDEVSIGTVPEILDGTFYRMTSSLTSQKASALSMLQDSCLAYSREHTPSDQQNSTHWLLTSASLCNYDKGIINAFLSLFKAHIAETFTTFHGFRVRQDTRFELTLAMAAVGGLFCDIPGSFNMAKAMHNSSQRNFIRSTFTTVYDRTASDISSVQTWILLILFGICSGNQRYHEIAEAHYMQMYKSAFECGILDPSLSRCEEEEEARRRLLCSIHMLECYRVILLQRPPNLYPSATPDLRFPDLADPASTKPLDRLTVLCMLQYLMTPGRPLDVGIESSQSVYSLASLSTLCWHAMSTSPATNTAAFPWRKEAFDLALDKWVNSHQDAPQASALILYHMISVGLHVNITHIHAIVRLRLSGAKNPNNLKKTSELAKALKTSEDCTIAIWHSSQIIRLAKDLTISQRTHSRGNPSMGVDETSSDVKRTSDAEPPHIAFCIYLAHLTLWTAAIGVSDPDIDGLNAQLDSGIYILSHLKVRVSKVIRNVLRRLKTN